MKTIVGKDFVDLEAEGCPAHTNKRSLGTHRTMSLMSKCISLKGVNEHLNIKNTI